MYVKEHYPELATVRGMIKTGNGKAVSNRSLEKYAEALNIYETTSEPLKSIALRLGLTYNSLGGFIRRNFPEAIERHNSLPASAEMSNNQRNNRKENKSDGQYPLKSQLHPAGDYILKDAY
jgi:hypothetical protein